MNKKNLFIVLGLLIFFGVVMKILPHAPNMTPVTAIAFAGSLYLGRKWAIVMPLVVLFLCDLIIGFYDWKILLSVYGAFTIIGLISIIAAKRRAVMPVGFALIGSSILFFLITNTAVWLFSPWYEKTISGLVYSHELGLPFLRNMLIGDILYTVALIFLFETCYFLQRHRHNIRAPLANVFITSRYKN